MLFVMLGGRVLHAMLSWSEEVSDTGHSRKLQNVLFPHS